MRILTRYVLREYLEYDRVRYPAVYYVCTADASEDRVKAPFYLGYHSSADDPAADAVLNVLLVQYGDYMIFAFFILFENSANVCQHDEL